MGRRKAPESETKARLDFAKTHTPEEFSEHFGITTSSARSFYNKNGMTTKKRPYSYEILDVEEVRKYAESHNGIKLAEHFNVTPGVMYKFLKENNIPVKRLSEAQSNGDWKPRGDRPQMIRYLARKFSVSSISSVIGVSRQAIYQILNMYGIDEEDDDDVYSR